MRAFELLLCVGLLVVCCSQCAYSLKCCPGPSGPFNWYAAQELCRSLGMKLATIDSCGKSEAVNRYLDSLNDPDAWYWIGATDQTREGTFKWWGTGYIVDYTNWASCQPDDTCHQENCVNIFHKQWYDDSCYVCHPKQFALCEDDPCHCP